MSMNVFGVGLDPGGLPSGEPSEARHPQNQTWEAMHPMTGILSALVQTILLCRCRSVCAWPPGREYVRKHVRGVQTKSSRTLSYCTFGFPDVVALSGFLDGALAVRVRYAFAIRVDRLRMFFPRSVPHDLVIGFFGTHKCNNMFCCSSTSPGALPSKPHT